MVLEQRLGIMPYCKNNLVDPCLPGGQNELEHCLTSVSLMVAVTLKGQLCTDGWGGKDVAQLERQNDRERGRRSSGP